MTLSRIRNVLLTVTCMAALASCSGFQNAESNEGAVLQGKDQEQKRLGRDNGSVLDIFRSKDEVIKVNRYLWTASLDVLDFLPVQTADPFTGVISTGYGTPPGGGRAYRATVLISDPALDARSLNVALQTRGGPVSAGTQRAVEDAILARARQLRIRAENF